MSEQEVARITQAIVGKFRCFGAGQTSNYNPIVNALTDQPAQFAAGVDVADVVRFVAQQIEEE